MLLDGTRFDKSEDNTYVAEASELGIRAPARSITLRNFPLEGMLRSFNLSRIDMPNREDIAGWWFEEADGPNKGNTSYLDPNDCKPCQPFSLLIIND